MRLMRADAEHGVASAAVRMRRPAARGGGLAGAFMFDERRW